MARPNFVARPCRIGCTRQHQGDLALGDLAEPGCGVDLGAVRGLAAVVPAVRLGPER